MANYVCLQKVYDYNIYYYKITKILCVQCIRYNEIDEEDGGYPHLIVWENLRTYRICHRCRRNLYVSRPASECALCTLLIPQLHSHFGDSMKRGGSYPVIREMILEDL